MAIAGTIFASTAEDSVGNAFTQNLTSITDQTQLLLKNRPLLYEIALIRREKIRLNLNKTIKIRMIKVNNNSTNLHGKMIHILKF